MSVGLGMRNAALMYFGLTTMRMDWQLRQPFWRDWLHCNWRTIHNSVLAGHIGDSFAGHRHAGKRMSGCKCSTADRRYLPPLRAGCATPG